MQRVLALLNGCISFRVGDDNTTRAIDINRYRCRGLRLGFTYQFDNLRKLVPRALD